MVFFFEIKSKNKKFNRFSDFGDFGEGFGYVGDDICVERVES